eukprot:TRINITY_DN5933_c0_g1_i1.p1 TRINITY_DN5933_c0_g1~~TRINITY_DN5933_c0_g1_i1.p1  ORF type:complete len:896 (+),score=194.35 TRINITY_DN5933_c0_g1_i1:1-2688(+)
MGVFLVFKAVVSTQSTGQTVSSNPPSINSNLLHHPLPPQHSPTHSNTPHPVLVSFRLSQCFVVQRMSRILPTSEHPLGGPEQHNLNSKAIPLKVDTSPLDPFPSLRMTERQQTKFIMEVSKIAPKPKTTKQQTKQQHKPNHPQKASVKKRVTKEVNTVKVPPEKEEEYFVDGICGKRYCLNCNGTGTSKHPRWEYQVKWWGYPGVLTWEDRGNLEHSSELLEAFEKGLKLNPNFTIGLKDINQNDNICGICHTDKNTQMVLCEGECLRSFHWNDCLQHKDGIPKGKWECSWCSTNTYPCELCGGFSSPNDQFQKCSSNNCGKFYHIDCVRVELEGFIEAQLPTDTNPEFLCPHHYCFCCKNKQIEGFKLYRCHICIKAFHHTCIDFKIEELDIEQGYIICNTCQPTLPTLKHKPNSNNKLRIKNNSNNHKPSLLKKEQTSLVKKSKPVSKKTQESVDISQIFNPTATNVEDIIIKEMEKSSSPINPSSPIESSSPISFSSPNLPSFASSPILHTPPTPLFNTIETFHTTELPQSPSVTLESPIEDFTETNTSPTLKPPLGETNEPLNASGVKLVIPTQPAIPQSKPTKRVVSTLNSSVGSKKAKIAPQSETKIALSKDQNEPPQNKHDGISQQSESLHSVRQNETRAPAETETNPTESLREIQTPFPPKNSETKTTPPKRASFSTVQTSLEHKKPKTEPIDSSRERGYLSRNENKRDSTPQRNKRLRPVENNKTKAPIENVTNAKEPLRENQAPSFPFPPEKIWEGTLVVKAGSFLFSVEHMIGYSFDHSPMPLPSTLEITEFSASNPLKIFSSIQTPVFLIARESKSNAQIVPFFNHLFSNELVALAKGVLPDYEVQVIPGVPFAGWTVPALVVGTVPKSPPNPPSPNKPTPPQ